MLRINRLRVIIRADVCDYGFDHEFAEGLNFIASNENTCGKSSVLEGIYYALGFEEIIGGKGGKVLTSVYKSIIEDEGAAHPVLESGIYLEISNGADVITIFRTAKMKNRRDELVTVHYCDMDKALCGDSDFEDMYVHLPNAAKNKKGFHLFLEKFLQLELPSVNNYQGGHSKLYLQMIFSSMFIEQKRGWADYYSGMPNFGIKDGKQRVTEFVLGLETMENEKNKLDLMNKRKSIEDKWEKTISSINKTCLSAQVETVNLPEKPQIFTEDTAASVVLRSKTGSTIEEFIHEKTIQRRELESMKPKVVDNFEGIQAELVEVEKQISEHTATLVNAKELLLLEKVTISRIEDNLETVNADISNNKDAARLQKLGSEIDSSIMKGTCPVCGQEMSDTLLPKSIDVPSMTIEENIKHLSAQKEMFEFSLEGRTREFAAQKEQIMRSEKELKTLRRLALSLRNDLFSVDESLSEAIVVKKIKLDDDIQALENIASIVKTYIADLLSLGNQWRDYLADKEKLPDEKLSDSDKKRISVFENQFKANLKTYGYKSFFNIEDIKISPNSYLPVIDNFDMKFDSSASDAIRAIWSFTMSLLQTSNNVGGNHPGVLIFDEPAQHSIMVSDTEAFFKDIGVIPGCSQVIVGITVNEEETRSAIEKLGKDSINYISVDGKAFRPLS